MFGTFHTPSLHKYKIFVYIFVCHPQIEIVVEIIVNNLSKAYLGSI